MRGREGDTANVPDKVTERYARLQGDLTQHLDQSNVEEAANIKSGKEKAGYTKAPELHATQKEIKLLEKRYPSLNPAPAEAAITTKTLDQNTAKSLLQEAGGDKDKARQLAKERGYDF